MNCKENQKSFDKHFTELLNAEWIRKKKKKRNLDLGFNYYYF